MLASIVPIVEGHSEVESVPIILRRMLAQYEASELKIERPIRVKRQRVVKPEELERYIALARKRPGCSAIMVVLDANDDCPKELAPQLLQRARDVAGDVYISVVLAKVELESWFIASVESLRGLRGVKTDVNSPGHPEEITGAKEWLSSAMLPGQSYVEVDDQPAFAIQFDFESAYQKCRSFRKFKNNFKVLVAKLIEEK